MKTLIFLLTSLPLVCSLGVIARPQTCTIRYGKLEKASYEAQAYNSGIIDERRDVVCYQIGDEYNSQGRLLEGKPIFACCQSDFS